MTARHENTSGRSALRLLGLAAAVGGMAVLAVLGWRWHGSRTVARVAVTGAEHTPPDTVRHLARVDSGAALASIDAARVAARVEHHPWVQDAAVTKQPVRRTLRVSVTERSPAALAVGDDGHPAYYLDRHGYALPLPDSADIDVPLVRGLETASDVSPRPAPPRLRELLGALGDSKAGPLVAEFLVQPDQSVRLLTSPLGAHGAIPVWMGKGPAEAKLRQLHAFVEQALATDPEVPVGEIDLRFDGQILTRTTPLNGP